MIGALLSWLTDPAHWAGSDGVPHRVAEHLGYSVLALLLAAVIAVPLGLFIGHTGRGTFLIAGLANALRALPTLGLLILAVLALISRLPGELGFLVPSIAVLVVLAVPPILSGSYAGVRSVPPEARDAAFGMGMTGREVLVKVEMPCALPLLFSGLRSAMLQIVSTATVAAYVGLGGLGRLLIDGLAVRDYPQMLAGALLVAVLAVLVELLLAGLQRLVVPRGLIAAARRGERRTRDVGGEDVQDQLEDHLVRAR
ncbi:ABC transporter permease [Thermasporomyces composti]|jgi:osmoprotectant transport system permease protein|uniref:Osmoprotectant transport system permease protein n=1 Tax=Thermasporomyces composti TaxID=696763 RepID=A0A3D9VH66_THECX|nr:ABC transporter permease subunit [Thermasporomyces composti]REF36651.1 osmoprotectant transport system permease protein [Thermasporomyces composti]